MSAPIVKTINGTSGDEDLIGSVGRDWIFGYAGKDRLYGQAGDDTLDGGEGNDLLEGGAGQDRMYGRSGSDIYRVDHAGDVVSEELLSGADDGAIDYVQSTISYRLGNLVERLELQGTADLNGAGNELANTVKGNSGNNVLAGRGGSDILEGGAGNDILVGGALKDYYTGGAGSDTFVIDGPNAASADKIYDFSGDDWLGIYATDFGLSEGNGLTGGKLDPTYFVTGSAATAAGRGQFIYNPANLTLYWDPDGTGSAARITISTLSAGAVVTADQFKIMNERPSVSISTMTTGSLAEDSGAAYFLVELAAPAREDVVLTYRTVNGTATGGSDFASATSAQITIPAGEVSAYIKLNLLDDNIAESLENFSVEIQSARLASSGQSLAIGPSQATASIVDEGPQIVASTNLAALGIPDPSGLAYHPGSQTLFLSDSEVDESPFFNPRDLYAFSTNGTLKTSYQLGFTSEATGLAYSPTTQSLFISDDDQYMVYRVNPNNPTVRLSQFNTLAVGGDDPEDLAVNPNNGRLFIVNGESRSIVEVNASGTLRYSTIVLPAEISDPEALVYDAQRDVFYVGGGFSSNIWCVDRSGNIVETIDLLSQFRNPINNARVYVKDLELAPASDGSGEMHLYVADFGWSFVNDGRLIEIDLGDPPATPMIAGLAPQWDLV